MEKSGLKGKMPQWLPGRQKGQDKHYFYQMDACIQALEATSNGADASPNPFIT